MLGNKFLNCYAEFSYAECRGGFLKASWLKVALWQNSHLFIRWLHKKNLLKRHSLPQIFGHSVSTTLRYP